MGAGTQADELDQERKPQTESRLLNLPPELQTAIIENLLRPSHLARVCLVCKQLQQIALPLLYREFSINVNQWEDHQLETFLVPGHSGHAYIRSIDVDSDDIDEEEAALKAAKDALQVLPRDCLRSFRCPLEDGVDNDLMILLAAQQRRLSSICLGPLRENAYNLIDALKPWPPSVETIIVPWRLLSTKDFDFYHDLIARSRERLKALTVRVQNFAWIYDSNPPAQAELQLLACEKLARGLFGHAQGRTYTKLPLELRDINFQNQDLGSFGETWIHYVDFTKLRTLQIWNCYNTDAMLRCLITLSKAQPLRLEGLVLSFEQAVDAPELTEEFLGTIFSLRYLNLCYMPPRDSNKGGFDVRCLKGHVDTIEDLYIGIGTNSSTDYSGSVTKTQRIWKPTLSDVQWLVQRCRRLKQLAIALPSLHIDDVVRGRLEQYMYLEHLVSAEIPSPTIFVSSLTISQQVLADLPRLKVLRILTWPTDDNHRLYNFGFDIQWRQHRSRYLKLLDILADTIARLFAHLRHAGSRRHDRLSVITFGNAERQDFAPTRHHGDMRMKEPVTYKVRRVESEFGWLMSTERMKAGEMQYEEPIAYVFDEDTDQGLSLEAYPWGSSSC